MAKNRGLYGQSEGNEKRNAGAATLEHYSANDLVEGDHVAVLNRMSKEQDWAGINSYTALLKANGHAQFRIDSMLNRATAGVKF